VVKAILEANRIRVCRERLPGGYEVLKVEPMQTLGTGAEAANEMAIRRVRGVS